MTNEEIFRTFLKSKRKYSAFKRLIKSTSVEQEVDLIILRSFIWSTSSEGTSKWYNIQGDWYKLCNEFKLTGTITYSEL